METLLQIYVLVGIYTTLVFYSCLTEEFICPKRKSYIVDGDVVFYNEKACCDNYEMRDNKCVECKTGYFRPFHLSPQNCLPCDEGTYGKKCVFTCNCNSNERCNSSIGCVNVFDLKDISTIDPPVTVSVNEFTGFNRQRIIHVVISGVMVVVILTCISSTFAFYRKRGKISVIGIMHSGSQNPSHFTTTQEEEVVEIDTLDREYEEIDETNMLNESMNMNNTIHGNDTDSNGSTTSPTEDDEGYLHPYHSFIHPIMIDNFNLDRNHSATNVHTNELLQSPYAYFQTHTKSLTTSGLEFIEIKDGLSTNSNKSGQKHAFDMNIDPPCSSEDRTKRVYAEVKRKNPPAQQDQYIY